MNFNKYYYSKHFISSRRGGNARAGEWSREHHEHPKTNHTDWHKINNVKHAFKINNKKWLLFSKIWRFVRALIHLRWWVRRILVNECVSVRVFVWQWQPAVSAFIYLKSHDFPPISIILVISQQTLRHTQTFGNPVYIPGNSNISHNSPAP